MLRLLLLVSEKNTAQQPTTVGRMSQGPRVTAPLWGQPQGTAGRPMLTTLLYSGVGEIVAVVTRYFGGTLLGTGGLVRAYQGAVKAGLETLPTKPMETGVRVLVSVGPEWISAVEHQVHVAGGRVVSTDFRYDASFELSIPEENVEAFETKLTDLTSGDALVERLDEE